MNETSHPSYKLLYSWFLMLLTLSNRETLPYDAEI
jgi:hypothetical protein